MNRQVKTTGLLASLVGAAGLLAGCSRDETTPEAKTALEASGIQSTEEVKSSTSEARSLIVEDTKRVIEPKTGQVLSEKTERTPVKVTREKEVRTDVDVDVGKTQPTVK